MTLARLPSGLVTTTRIRLAPSCRWTPCQRDTAIVRAVFSATVSRLIGSTGTSLTESFTCCRGSCWTDTLVTGIAGWKPCSGRRSSTPGCSELMSGSICDAGRPTLGSKSSEGFCWSASVPGIAPLVGTASVPLDAWLTSRNEGLRGRTPERIMSTRRFSCRPAAVALSATGSSGPRPSTETEFSATLSARAT